MANDFPSYTNCVAPSRWSGPPYTQTVIAAIISVLFGAGVWALALAVPGAAWGFALLCVAATIFVRWWLYVRLICLGGDRSVIGAIYYLEVPTESLTNIDDYDTDYSFNLLLWPFIPQDELPASFVSQQWSPAALPQLIADWPTLFPSIAWTDVADQVELILPQQSMASLNVGFGGQNVESGDQPMPQPATGSSQHFLMHCEIEGPGMYDLLIFLYAMLAVFLAITIVSFIPGVGTLISVGLLLLALLAMLIGLHAIVNDVATPPQGGGFGGSFNSYDSGASADAPVDIAYVVGRWVYDSLHGDSASNELHPVHFMMKIVQTNPDGTILPTTKGDIGAGNWPPGLGAQKAKLDAMFGVINDPTTILIQKQPQNHWKLHPLLDGCEGATPYPTPPPGVIV